MLAPFFGWTGQAVIRYEAAANDLALLKVSGRFPALPLQSSRGVELGETVFTVGFPNITLQGMEPKLTEAKISSLSGVQDDPRYFQISVAVQPGNSGGRGCRQIERDGCPCNQRQFA
jgi:S1-C subfamily serine protease